MVLTSKKWRRWRKECKLLPLEPTRNMEKISVAPWKDSHKNAYLRFRLIRKPWMFFRRICSISVFYTLDTSENSNKNKSTIIILTFAFNLVWSGVLHLTNLEGNSVRRSVPKIVSKNWIWNIYLTICGKYYIRQIVDTSFVPRCSFRCGITCYYDTGLCCWWWWLIVGRGPAGCDQSGWRTSKIFWHRGDHCTTVKRLSSTTTCLWIVIFVKYIL